MLSLSSPNCCQETHSACLNPQLSARFSCPMLASVRSKKYSIKESLRKYKFDKFLSQIHGRDCSYYASKDIALNRHNSCPVVLNHEADLRKCWKRLNKNNYAFECQLKNGSVKNCRDEVENINDENKWERYVHNFSLAYHPDKNDSKINATEESSSYVRDQPNAFFATGEHSSPMHLYYYQQNTALSQYCNNYCGRNPYFGYDHKEQNTPSLNYYFSNQAAAVNCTDRVAQSNFDQLQNNMYQGHYQSVASEDQCCHCSLNHSKFIQGEDTLPFHHQNGQRKYATLYSAAYGEPTLGAQPQCYWCTAESKRVASPITNYPAKEHAANWHSQFNAELCGCHAYCSNFGSRLERNTCYKGCWKFPPCRYKCPNYFGNHSGMSSRCRCYQNCCHKMTNIDDKKVQQCYNHDSINAWRCFYDWNHCLYSYKHWKTLPEPFEWAETTVKEKRKKRVVGKINNAVKKVVAIRLRRGKRTWRKLQAVNRLMRQKRMSKKQRALVCRKSKSSQNSPKSEACAGEWVRQPTTNCTKEEMIKIDPEQLNTHFGRNKSKSQTNYSYVDPQKVVHLEAGYSCKCKNYHLESNSDDVIAAENGEKFEKIGVPCEHWHYRGRKASAMFDGERIKCSQSLDPFVPVIECFQHFPSVANCEKLEVCNTDSPSKIHTRRDQHNCSSFQEMADVGKGLVLDGYEDVNLNLSATGKSTLTTFVDGGWNEIFTGEGD